METVVGGLWKTKVGTQDFPNYFPHFSMIWSCGNVVDAKGTLSNSRHGRKKKWQEMAGKDRKPAQQVGRYNIRQ